MHPMLGYIAPRLAATLAAAAALMLLAFAPAPASAQIACPPGVILPGCEEPPPGGDDPPDPDPDPDPEPPPPPPEPDPCPLIKASGKSTFTGMVSEDVYVAGPAYRRCELSRQVKAGVRIVRQPFRWSEIEGSKGNYDFATWYDEYVGTVAEHGLSILPVLFDPPTWRSSRPARNAAYGTYPPKSFKAMGRFAAQVARRYGPKGSFWRENRGIPKRPIRAWQVWNEPNLPPYWPTGPNAREYTAMLRAVAKALRKVDRKAEIVTGGLPQSGIKGAKPLVGFLKGMYKAGARKHFDTLGLNPYARSKRQLVKRIRSVRRVMNRKKHKRARIWITEMGWATGGPKSRFSVSPEKQAKLVRQALRTARKKRKRFRIRGAVYFGWKDSAPYRGVDFWGLHTGLNDVDGNPKPALDAFSRSSAR